MVDKLTDLVREAANEIQHEGMNLIELTQITEVPTDHILDYICMLAGKDHTERTVSKAVRMAESLVLTYESRSKGMVARIADYLHHIPSAGRDAYIDDLRMLADQEYQSFNKEYALPRLIEVMGIQFAADHRQGVEDRSDKRKHDQAVQKLEKDVQRFMQYAKAMVTDNAAYKAKPSDISVDDCFKKSDGARIDYSILSEDVVQHAALNLGVDAFVRVWGFPVGMANRGIRGEKDVTIRLFFGDSGQHQVAATYPSGLSSRELNFYREMTLAAKPIDALHNGTRKCRDFLETY